MPPPRRILQTNLEGPPLSPLSGRMSRTAHGAVRALDRTERMHRWMAALLTALLHVLLVLVMLQDPPITVTTPQSEAGGSRMNVTLIDQTLPPSPAEPVPPVHKHVAPKKPKAPRAIKRPLPVQVAEATEPMPPEAADMPDDASTPPPTPAPEQPDTARDVAPVNRPPHVAGQPPGMRMDDNARASAALAAKLGSNRGRSDRPAPAGPDMGVEGFHVYYDLVNENRLREWRDQGMTELFLPLPGTRRLMVCPLEVALRRGSGNCRMIDSDAPELKSIGDAREVIGIQRVYQLGNEVWSGPGAYR